MIDTQSIRTKILDLAMRGQLTEQLPEDGTAEELYRQIQEDKQALIKAGKIKKEKPLPEITEGEKPFEIPKSWKWVRLGKVITLVSGTDYKPEEYNAENRGVPYITGASNLLSEGVLINRWTENPRCIANYGDVLLVCKGSGYGKVAMCDIEVAHIARQIMALKKTDSLAMEYILYFLMANFDYLKSKGQGLIPGVDRQNVLSMLFPLSPLAEQQRIVDRVQQAFSALDTIDELQTQYADNLTVLKSKLIDAAIQGKLTAQLPEDGTAEELYQQIQEEKQFKCESGEMKKTKLLPEITSEEIPFVEPERWRWCRLESLYNFIDYRGATPNKITEGVPFVTAKNVRQGYIDYTLKEFISEEDYQKRQSRGISHKGDLLFTTEAPMGYAAIADLEKYSAGQRLITLQQYTNTDLLDNRFYMYYISAKFFQKQLDAKCSGTTVKGIKADRLKLFLVPLPPLAEQKRIVSRLEEILPLCVKPN